MIFKILLSFLFVFVAANGNIEECKPLAMSLKPIVEAINVTDRFFRAPEEYKKYADTCEAILNCFKSKDTSAIPDLMEKLSRCHFYIFYNREFSNCAHKLIAKKDDKIPCLNTLFNDIYEPDVDQCQQWDSLQPCIKEQIGKVCGDQIVPEYVKQEKNLRPEMCEEGDE